MRRESGLILVHDFYCKHKLMYNYFVTVVQSKSKYGTVFTEFPLVVICGMYIQHQNYTTTSPLLLPKQWLARLQNGQSVCPMGWCIYMRECGVCITWLAGYDASSSSISTTAQRIGSTCISAVTALVAGVL